MPPALEGQGNIDSAIAQYKSVISKYPGDSIVSPAKLTLARLYEEKAKADEALKLYDELGRSPSPYDPWAGEARERKEVLLTKHPELRVTTPAPVVPPVAPMTPAPAPVKAK